MTVSSSPATPRHRHQRRPLAASRLRDDRSSSPATGTLGTGIKAAPGRGRRPLTLSSLPSDRLVQPGDPDSRNRHQGDRRARPTTGALGTGIEATAKGKPGDRWRRRAYGMTARRARRSPAAAGERDPHPRRVAVPALGGGRQRSPAAAGERDPPSARRGAGARSRPAAARLPCPGELDRRRP